MEEVYLMEERDIFFEQINIEPSKIYTNSKFKIRIMLAGDTRLTSENGDVLNTEDMEKLILE